MVCYQPLLGTSAPKLIVHPGTLGSAILYGLLASLAEETPSRAPQKNGIADGTNGHAHSSPTDPSFQKPTHFIACVRTAASAERLQNELARFLQPVPVTILQNENVPAVQAASTILLSCQPQDLESCLRDPALLKALRGKLLISILAGVTIPQIEEMLSPSRPTKPAAKTNGSTHALAQTTIVRAMPNTASFVRSSTTVITSTHTAAASSLALVNYLFTTIGSVTHIPASQFDACTALCGSTPSFFALFLEGLLDGAVALGLKRSEAQVMAAETMKGAAMLMLEGESPERLKEKVATPGGSTIQGLLELERRAVRGVVADALVRCTVAAGGLGQKGS